MIYLKIQIFAESLKLECLFALLTRCSVDFPLGLLREDGGRVAGRRAKTNSIHASSSSSVQRWNVVHAEMPCI